MIERMKAGKVGEQQKEAKREEADKILPVIGCAFEITPFLTYCGLADSVPVRMDWTRTS